MHIPWIYTDFICKPFLHSDSITITRKTQKSMFPNSRALEFHSCSNPGQMPQEDFTEMVSNCFLTDRTEWEASSRLASREANFLLFPSLTAYFAYHYLIDHFLWSLIWFHCVSGKSCVLITSGSSFLSSLIWMMTCCFAKSSFAGLYISVQEEWAFCKGDGE